MADDDGILSIANRVAALRRRHALRDKHAAEVRAVRHGDFDKVAPGLFSDEWPRSIVANRVDVYAKHASAALSPLPIISCMSGTSTSDAAREFADKRTKIANHYVRRSRLADQMQSGADQFYTYGLIVGSVEPDFDEKMPTIIVEDSSGFYPRWDRLGRTVECARVFTRTAGDLLAEYPEHAPKIREALTNFGEFRSGETEVVKYDDGKRIVTYLPEAGNLVLEDRPNRLGKCHIVAVRKPGLDDEIRGTFDDLIWVQLALHAMQTYTVSAAAQAVNAPLAAPDDVTEVNVGPGSVIRSREPDKIRRVPLDVPMSAWGGLEMLASEMEYGAITPEALGGSIDASVVTGKGVQQLMAGYSQQIAMGQSTLVGWYEQIISLCFLMDERFWPNETKVISGRADGTPYKATYRPSRDIKGDYSVEVQYGGIAGLDPNRALVMLLQADGAGLVSKDYVRRHLPSDINPDEEAAKITVEQVRGSLIQGLSALIQSIPQQVMNGQDPSEIIAKSVTAVKELQKGRELEDVLAELFPLPEPEPQIDPATGEPAPGGDGLTPAGMPPGLRPGMATEGPGARPPLEMLFAGLTAGGEPNLQAGVSRMNPARTV